MPGLFQFRGIQRGAVSSAIPPSWLESGSSFILDLKVELPLTALSQSRAAQIPGG